MVRLFTFHKYEICRKRLKRERSVVRDVEAAFIAPGSRRWPDQSHNVRASFAGRVRAPQASWFPSAQPYALACDGGHWSAWGRENHVRQKGCGTTQEFQWPARR